MPVAVTLSLTTPPSPTGLALTGGVAGGTAPYSSQLYQQALDGPDGPGPWVAVGTPVAGAAPAFGVAPVPARGTYAYHVTSSDSAGGSATSSDILVRVPPEPQLIPADGTAVPGATLFAGDVRNYAFVAQSGPHTVAVQGFDSDATGASLMLFDGNDNLVASANEGDVTGTSDPIVVATLAAGTYTAVVTPYKHKLRRFTVTVTGG